MEKQILREGQNCWRIARSSRVKFLIDGAAYFSVLAEALERARESILIVGWDFDGRIRLRPEEKIPAPVSSKDLGTFLQSELADPFADSFPEGWRSSHRRLPP